MYKSDKVSLAVCGLGVACVVGVVLWAAFESEETEAPEYRRVSVSTTYAHNTHVPGAGWFDVTTRRFEPFAYNTYVSGRGYYREGGWHEAAGPMVALSATPTPEAVRQANESISAAETKSAGSTGSSGGHYSRSSGSGSGSSRGGFGSSGGGSGS